jgi:endonuclease III
MKNASKYAESLKSIQKSLLKEGKPQPPEKQDPLRALVRGAMLYDVPDNRADEAMKAIEHEFVNLNELRVATDLEIQELLGQRYPHIEQRVSLITKSLNAIFEKEHTLSLDRLKTVSKKDARQFLRDLPEMHPFVEAYVMLVGFEASAVPVDEEMMNWFREHGVFEEKTTLDEAQRFLENHLKAEDCAEFFMMMRRALGSDKGKRKAKA